MTDPNQNRRPRLISFSGMDGAGKSTQITALRRRVEEAGQPVRLITFWEDVARLTNLREASGHTLFRGDKGVGTPAAPIVRKDKNVRSWWMTWVRLGLYFVDAVSLRLVLKRALRSNPELVICDRYIYDELANLPLRYPSVRAYIRLIMMIVPRPHISYLLDADPAAAYARKPEYPLEFLYSSRASYQALSDLVGGVTVIAAGSPREVEREIWSHLSPDQP
jgi:thymidylate kinase